MTKWRIVSGARAFHKLDGREDVSIGWARDLQKDGELRTVNVCVAVGVEEEADLAEASRAAIRSHGRTAINAVLDEENPPRIIDVTTGGLVPDYHDDDDVSAAGPGTSTANA